MRLSDENSRYFHAIINQRNRQNFIHKVLNLQGEECCSPFTVTDAFINFYKQLMGTSNPVQPLKLDCIRQGAVLSTGHQQLLRAPVTPEEIHTALFSMDKNKAPGLDGYTAGFFQAAWGIIGPEICEAIMTFFRNGKLLRQINSTLITLVAKKANESKSRNSGRSHSVTSYINLLLRFWLLDYKVYVPR